MYKELLRVRSTLFWYTIALAAITTVIAIVALAFPQAMSTNDSGKGLAHIPWVGLFAAAGFGAAIISTLLGSTLAQENDHLEVAWTKPRSRTSYATGLMAINASGIVAAQLIGFAFILAHFAIYHRNEHIISTPQDTINVIRFALFPLAWYGLIVALSASMRGRATVVQGLIWPVAFGVAGGAVAPLPEILQRVCAMINLINPMSYASYEIPNIALPTAALALIVVASWAAATFQWRRLQA